MSKEKEVLRLLHLGLSQRAIMKSAKVSAHLVVRIRKFCKERQLSYAEALELDDDDLKPRRKKGVKISNAKRPDTKYIHSELKKKGVTLKLLHDEYVQECLVTGEEFLKYTQFCNVYKEYVEDNKLTMHIERKPGERIEVDWAGGTIPIYNNVQSEVIGKAYIFVAVLPFSQYMYAAASLNMKTEAWINHHINMFRFFEGAATILQIDNLKTGVISHKKYEEIVYNQAFQEMCEYYDTAVMASRVRHPKDKASAEGSVGYLTNEIIGRLRNRRFTSIYELNEKIEQVVNELNRRPFQKRDYSRFYVFDNEEKEYLKPLPEMPYQYALWKKAIVQLNYHVSFDYNYYSVPYKYTRKEVDLRISQNMIELFYQGERIASHVRLLSGKGRYMTIEEHMPKNHKEYGEWNKERILMWAQKCGPSVYQVIQNIFKRARFEVQVYHQCITILKLSQTHSKQILDQACEYILEQQITPIHKNFKTIIQQIESNLLKEEKKGNVGAILRGSEYYGGKK